MNKAIAQATDDEITYLFNVGGLGVNIISSVTADSTVLAITAVTNTATSISLKVDSTNVKGNAVVDTVITLSNGDVENKCIKFVVGAICIN